MSYLIVPFYYTFLNSEVSVDAVTQDLMVIMGGNQGKPNSVCFYFQDSYYIATFPYMPDNCCL